MYLDSLKGLSASESFIPDLILNLDFRYPNDLESRLQIPK